MQEATFIPSNKGGRILVGLTNLSTGKIHHILVSILIYSYHSMFLFIRVSTTIEICHSDAAQLLKEIQDDSSKSSFLLDEKEPTSAQNLILHFLG